MRISDWSSDVCSSDLYRRDHGLMSLPRRLRSHHRRDRATEVDPQQAGIHPGGGFILRVEQGLEGGIAAARLQAGRDADPRQPALAAQFVASPHQAGEVDPGHRLVDRSEEHTSELPSLMRISYAVFCLKKKTKN